MNSKILIIDDEKDICFLISEILEDEKFLTESALNSDEALKKFNKFKPNLVILDVWLGNSQLDGIELLKEFKKINPLTPIIIISGHGTVDMAVNAIKNGAYDFLEKPFNSDKIIILVKRAIESAALITENKTLKKIADPKTPLIGESSFIKELNKKIAKISQSNSRVFISGPIGSGKKLIAKTIHKLSSGSSTIANIIDFKNLNKNDLEDIFLENNQNIYENIFFQSNNGTLIFDNIETLPVNYQKKLLNILENEKNPINNNINFNLKIISISSKNIDLEIQNGNFIKSLYERLNVISIKVPPISDRKSDIIPICNHYLNSFNVNKKYKFTLSEISINKLEMYEWPGNIRQIINYIEKTIILNQDLNLNCDIELSDLPSDMGENEENSLSTNNFALSLKEARQNFEREYLISQIKRFDGNITKISDFTGMERTALYRKFKSLNISLENK